MTRTSTLVAFALSCTLLPCVVYGTNDATNRDSWYHRLKNIYKRMILPHKRIWTSVVPANVVASLVARYATGNASQRNWYTFWKNTIAWSAVWAYIKAFVFHLGSQTFPQRCIDLDQEWSSLNLSSTPFMFGKRVRSEYQQNANESYYLELPVPPSATLDVYSWCRRKLPKHVQNYVFSNNVLTTAAAIVVETIYVPEMGYIKLLPTSLKNIIPWCKHKRVEHLLKSKARFPAFGPMAQLCSRVRKGKFHVLLTNESISKNIKSIKMYRRNEDEITIKTTFTSDHTESNTYDIHILELCAGYSSKIPRRNQSYTINSTQNGFSDFVTAVSLCKVLQGLYEEDPKKHITVNSESWSRFVRAWNQDIMRSLDKCFLPSRLTKHEANKQIKRYFGCYSKNNEGLNETKDNENPVLGAAKKYAQSPEYGPPEKISSFLVGLHDDKTNEELMRAVKECNEIRDVDWRLIESLRNYRKDVYDIAERVEQSKRTH